MEAEGGIAAEVIVVVQEALEEVGEGQENKAPSPKN